MAGEALLEGGAHHRFAVPGVAPHPGFDGAFAAVEAFAGGGDGGDVAGGGVAVAECEEEAVGAECLGPELELQESLAGEEEELGVAEVEVGQVEGAAAPTEAQGVERLGGKGDGGVGNLAFVVLGGEAGFVAGRHGQGHGSGAHLLETGTRRGFPGGLHTGKEALAEDGPVAQVAVGVFARSDIAGDGGEIDMGNLGVCLAPEGAGDAGEVRRNTAFAVGGDGMDGEGAEGAKGFGAIPEGEHAEGGVDESRGERLDGGVGDHGGAVEVDGAVGELDAAVAGEVLDLADAGTDVGDGLGGRQGLAQGRGDGGEGGLVESRVAEAAAGDAGLVENGLSAGIHDGSVVLVEGGDEDAAGGGVGSRGEDGAPPVVRGVADLAPVHGDQHDGRAAAGEDDAARAEGIEDLAGGFDGPGQKRVAERGRDAGLEIRQTPGRAAASGEGGGGGNPVSSGDARSTGKRQRHSGILAAVGGRAGQAVRSLKIP